MCKLKLVINSLLLIALLATASESMAYVIYNKTDQALRVQDAAKTGGLSKKIAPGNNEKCNPGTRYCYGDMDIIAGTTKPDAHNRWISCEWRGIIGNDSGHYFVITKSNIPGIKFPDYGWCEIKHYHD